MNNYDNSKETYKFLEVYFKSRRIKKSIWYVLLWVIFMILTKEIKYLLMSCPIVIILSFILYLLVPDLLFKETINFTEKFYDTSRNYEEKALRVVCNLKKLDGPTFGILQIDEEKIEFKPFKDNLQSERIFINRKDIKTIHIELIQMKFQVLDRLLFKELSKGIKISFGSSSIILQLADLEMVIKNMGFY